MDKPEYQTRALLFLDKLIDQGTVKNQTDLAAKLKVSKQQINSFYKKGYVSKPIIEQLCKIYNDARSFIYQDSTKSMERGPVDRKMNEPTVHYGKSPIKRIEEDPDGKRIPVLDTEVYASIVSVLSGSITLPPDTFIRIPIFSDGEAAVQVWGHSMKGYINNGDWVIIKRLTDRRSIMYGEAHLVVTKADNLQTVKFIKPSEDEDMLSLVSYNFDQFGESQEIYKEDILAIYRVVGSFRRH